MVLTIGMFDGVHLGHKRLVDKVVSRAKDQNLLSGVVTFRTHPRELFAPRTRLSYLTTIEERETLLKAEGTDSVIVLSFTRELSQLTAREFLGLLMKHLRMKDLVVGPDAALGKNRTGTVAEIRELSKEMGFTLTVMPPQKISGEVISSTAIRNALAEGEMHKVTRLLGRPFSLQGKVVTGQRRGSDIGFPTANIDVGHKQALPPDGVYATHAYIEGKKYQSMTNIGRCPTFGAHNQRTIEVYILDYKGDIYGKDLKIELVERLREEKKFGSVEALQEQIAADVKRGREILTGQEKK
jgi:riboflavin kinase/FMN adenylyltransferase